MLNDDGTLRTRSRVVRRGGYIAADLRAGDRLSEQLSFSVNVNNLFDRHYYACIPPAGRDNYYGSPRGVFATFRYNSK